MPDDELMVALYDEKNEAGNLTGRPARFSEVVEGKKRVWLVSDDDGTLSHVTVAEAEAYLRSRAVPSPALLPI